LDNKTPLDVVSPPSSALSAAPHNTTNAHNTKTLLFRHMCRLRRRSDDGRDGVELPEHQDHVRGHLAAADRRVEQ
jgi:hypothetical protein